MPVKFTGITGLVTFISDIPKLALGTPSQVPVKFEDIIMFSNNSRKLKNHYIWFKTKDGQIYYLRYSLAKIFEELPDYFARINEHQIVNFLTDAFQGRINGRRLIFENEILKITDTFKPEFDKRFYQYYLPPIHKVAR